MNELAKIDSFRKELAIAETIEEIKLIGDAANAYQYILKRQGANKNKIDEIGDFGVDVECREAEWLNEFYPSRVNINKRADTKMESAKMPVTPKESARVRKIKEYKESKPDVFNEIKKTIKKSKDENLNGKSVYKHIKKIEKEEQIEDQKQKILSGEMSLPEGIFDIIVVDPPWPYGRKYDPDTSRSANPYPEMSIDEIKGIKLTPDKDCILWLWTTHRFIWDAKNIMDSWGFEYKGILVWNKEKMGMGDWLRMQCEFCLVGIKGKPFWNVKDLRDIITESRTEHSSKPESFYKMIEDKFVSKNKADYFGRKERKGWKINNGKINLK